MYVLRPPKPKTISKPYMTGSVPSRTRWEAWVFNTSSWDAAPMEAGNDDVLQIQWRHGLVTSTKAIGDLNAKSSAKPNREPFLVLPFKGRTY